MVSSNLRALLAVVLSITLEPVAAFSFMHKNQPSNIDITPNYSTAMPRRQYLLSLGIATSIIQSSKASAHEANLAYQGVYTDSKYPKGYRVLIGDTKKATLQIQNDPSDKVYNIPVTIDTIDGTLRFIFDYSLIENDSAEVVGTLTKDREGINLISFANGTWKERETGPIGVYYDSSNEAKRAVIRQLKGSEWAVAIFDGDKVVECRAKAGNPIMIALPEGEVKGVFDMKGKTITFEDGNVWTKF